MISALLAAQAIVLIVSVQTGGPWLQHGSATSPCPQGEAPGSHSSSDMGNYNRTLHRGGKTGSDAGPGAKTRISKEAGESPNGACCATSSAATFFLGLPRKGVCAGAFRSGARSGSGLRPRAFFSGIRI